MARIEIPGGDGEDRQRMWQLRPELGAAAENFSAVVQASTILSVREHEAARIRIAHLNGCEPCSEARMEGMQAWGIDESFYDDVDDPSRRSRYSPREVIAIEFAERFVAGGTAFDDEFWARCRDRYTDAEIVDLATSCAKWLGLGRINVVLGLTVSCPIRIAPPRQAEPLRAAT
jgi:alkylhydroperoxidase family enzyme